MPKDGPSAGITMTVALLSALTNTPVKGSVAMTGEISLRGRVLPIGGLKEKTMAAYKYGMKTVVIPKANEPDLDEIDKTVKEHLSFVTVESIDEVLPIAFENGGYAKSADGTEKVSDRKNVSETKSAPLPRARTKKPHGSTAVV